MFFSLSLSDWHGVNIWSRCNAEWVRAWQSINPWLIGPQSITLPYIKINVVSALCYCLIKEIYIDFKYRFLLVESGEKWQMVAECVCVCLGLHVCVCSSVFMPWLNDAVEIYDPARGFIFPCSTETGRRVVRFPSISLWPQSFTGSSSFPAS